MEREKDPRVVRLPRKAGQKEVRYAHVLSGEVVVEDNALLSTVAPVTKAASDDRVAVLEQTVSALQSEVGDLRRLLEEFRKQFE